MAKDTFTIRGERGQRKAYPIVGLDDFLLPRNLILSIVYLLAIETLPVSSRNKYSNPTMRVWRRLARFDNWVDCACKELYGCDCGMQWNPLVRQGVGQFEGDTIKVGDSTCILQTKEADRDYTAEAVVTQRNWKNFYKTAVQLPVRKP